MRAIIDHKKNYGGRMPKSFHMHPSLCEQFEQDLYNKYNIRVDKLHFANVPIYKNANLEYPAMQCCDNKVEPI